MREPNLLIISNRFEETNLEEDMKAEFVKWDWPLKKLWTFSDYHVVIIDFSFNKDEFKGINQEIYDSLGGRLLEVIEGLIVIVICGYPKEKFNIYVPRSRPDESRYLHSQTTCYDPEDLSKEVVKEERDSYTFLQGVPIGIYDRLTPEPSRIYEKKIKSPFKEYFNLTDIAHLTIQYSPPPSDISVEPISRTSGVGKDRYCVGALIEIEKGNLILLPGYNKLKKNEVLLSLIKISKELYRKQQKLKERGQ